MDSSAPPTPPTSTPPPVFPARVLRLLGVLFRSVGGCVEAGADALDFANRHVVTAWRDVRKAGGAVVELVGLFGGGEAPDAPPGASASAPPAAPAPGGQMSAEDLS